MIKIAIFVFTFMTAIDITCLATIMPQVISSLGDMHLYPLMSSAYLMAFFITAPIFGKVSDHFGCKKASFVALVLFLVGSLFSGVAFSMQELVIFRFIQGIGACGLVNICSILIARLYTESHERSFMQAILSVVWALASILGPLIGASLAAHFSWRFVFLLNLPLGIIAWFILRAFEEKHSKVAESFDKKSILLFCVGTLLVFIFLAKAPLSGFGSWKIACGISGIALLAFFVKRSLTSLSPVIPFHLLRDPQIACCVIFGIISGICITTSYTLISLYIQGALRLSIASAGSVIMACSIGWAAGSFFCSYLLRLFNLRSCFLLSSCVLATGFSLLAMGEEKNTLAYFVICNSILGFGLGSMVNMTIVGMQQAAETRFLGRATSFLSVMRSLGTSSGAALAGLLQLFYFRTKLEALQEGGVASDVAAKLLLAPEKFLDATSAQSMDPAQFSQACQLFAESIQEVFLLPVILLVLSAPLAFLLVKPKKHATA